MMKHNTSTVCDCGFELVDFPPYSPDLAAIATTHLCAEEFPDEAAPPFCFELII